MAAVKLKANSALLTIQCKNTLFSIGFEFVALLTLLLIFDKSGVGVRAVSAAAIHEAGHLAALFFLSFYVKKIHLGIFGIRIETANNHIKSYFKDILVFFAGPFANIAVFVFLILFFGGSKTLTLTAFINLFLAVFNLLPIAPLDGGRILSSMLSSRLSRQKSESIIKMISIIFIVILFILGILLLLVTKYNITLFITSCYLLFLLLLKK